MRTRRCSPIALCLLLAASCGSSTSSVATSPVEGGTSACGSMTTFRLEKASGSTASDCVATPQWVAILDAGGTELVTHDDCATRCEPCQAPACSNVMQMPEEVPSDGLSDAWDGTRFASGTCGASVSCVRQECASPGTYKARACVFPRPGADGGGTCQDPRDQDFLCGEATFAFPSSEPVVFPLP